MHRAFRAISAVAVVLVLAACAATPAVAPLPPDAGPAQQRALELQQACGASRTAMDCYSERLLALLGDQGVAFSMEVLEALSERDPAVRREGHMYAHHIGLAADRGADSVGDTFRQCTPAFQSGCYHGVIQAYFADLSSSGQAIDGAAIDRLCAEYREGEEDRWLLFQCVHGLGHGLTLLHGFHLPGALAGCDHLSEEWDREGCYGGVFMESIVNATAPHHTVGRPDAGGQHHDHGAPATPVEHAGHGGGDEHAGHAGHGAPSPAAHVDEPFPPLDPDDPLYPCTVLEDRYLVACYQMQTSAILFHNGQNVRATATACDAAPELYRGHCYLSLGRDISALTQQSDTRARAACTSGDPEYQVWCHIGYTKNLVDLTADPLDGLAYCRGAEGAELKQACYHAVGEQIAVITGDVDRGEAWCAEAEAPHRDHCRRGAGLISWRDPGAG